MVPLNPAQPPPKRLANPAIPEAIETISFPGRAADGEVDGETELPVADPVSHRLAFNPELPSDGPSQG